MAQITLKPTVIRIILAVSIGLMTIANIAIFFLGKDIIAESSQSLTELSTELKKSQNEIEKIESIKSQMEQIKDIPDLVTQATADKTDNRHQEKIIKTLEEYAQKTGLVVKNINFATSSSVVTQDKSTVMATISFSQPTNYTNVIKFMKLTEIGLPRMQITDVSMSVTNSEEGGIDAVSTSTIQIKIYAS